MLIILKLFKLKLLLFLPFILGLTGLKKILGLAALVVPGESGISVIFILIRDANWCAKWLFIFPNEKRNCQESNIFIEELLTAFKIIVSEMKIQHCEKFNIPGIIGYFKLCRPTSGFNNHIYSQDHIPQYSSQGLGGASYSSSLYSKYPSNSNPYRQDPSFSAPYNNYYRDASPQDGSSPSGGVRFGEEDAQDLAYRNSKISS